MDPFSMMFGGLGAVANIFSSSQTAANNAYIAELNYKNEEDKLNAMVNQANKEEQYRNQQYSDTKLGATDAAGNRTHFVEGQGWVVDETPQQKAIDNQQRMLDSTQTQEQMNKLLIDAPRQRAQSEQIAKNDYRADQMADAYGRMLSNHIDTDPTQQGNIDGLTAALNAKARSTDGLRDAATDAVRGSMGTNEFSSMAGRVGTADLSDIAAAFAGGRTSGRQDALKENSANSADFTNLFNNFAGQAKTPVGGSSVSPVGTNIFGDTSINNAQTQGAAQMNNDANQLGSALEAAFTNAPVPQMDYESPNNSIGNALMSMAGMMGASGGQGAVPLNKKYTSNGVSYSAAPTASLAAPVASSGFQYKVPLGYGGIGHM